MRRALLLLIPALVGVLTVGMLIAYRDSGRLPGEDLEEVRALEDVDAALEWRRQAELQSSRYVDMEQALSMGYWRLHDSNYGPWEHLIKWGAVEDDRLLDVTEPEILVYRFSEGRYELQALAFILPTRYNQANTPPIAGGSGVWHRHPTICLEGDPFVDPGRGRLIATLADSGGRCIGGENFPDVLMVHAWVHENACGPFAPSLADDTGDLEWLNRALAGADGDGNIPGCDVDLAERVWGAGS